MSLRKNGLRATAIGMALLTATCVMAQGLVVNPDWREAEVPPPPAYNTNKLIKIDMGPNVGLNYGVDPATVSISEDGVIRYVMVATSPSGAMNAMYEGIRCATGEFKTYGRFNDGQWKLVAMPEWRTLFEKLPSRHAMAFAKQGACSNTSTARSVDELVRTLKNPRGDLPR